MSRLARATRLSSRSSRVKLGFRLSNWAVMAGRWELSRAVLNIVVSYRLQLIV